MIPPTIWLIVVAIAAPATPHSKIAMNSQSRNIFVTPAATVTASPSLGFSAVMRKLWNTFWSMNEAVPIRMMLPYVTQSSSISSSAPNRMETGRMRNSPTTPTTTPMIIVTTMSIENSSFARLSLPSPKVFATSAVPPVPSINPIPPNTMTSGMTRFTAANGV